MLLHNTRVQKRKNQLKLSLDFISIHLRLDNYILNSIKSQPGQKNLLNPADEKDNLPGKALR